MLEWNMAQSVHTHCSDVLYTKLEWLGHHILLFTVHAHAMLQRNIDYRQVWGSAQLSLPLKRSASMYVSIHSRLSRVMLVCKNAIVTFWNVLWNKNNNNCAFIQHPCTLWKTNYTLSLWSAHAKYNIILYKLNYLDFTSFNTGVIVLPMLCNQVFSSNAFKICFEVHVVVHRCVCMRVKLLF